MLQIHPVPEQSINQHCTAAAMITSCYFETQVVNEASLEKVVQKQIEEACSLPKLFDWAPYVKHALFCSIYLSISVPAYLRQ